MPYEGQIALSIAILFFAVGLSASFLPVLLDSIIAWVGIVIHKLWLWEGSVSWTFFSIATFLVILAQGVDVPLPTGACDDPAQLGEGEWVLSLTVYLE